MHLVDTFRRYMGWCPQADFPKARTMPSPGPDVMIKKPAPGIPEAPAPAVAAPAEHRPEYQTNLLLILVFVGGVFLASRPDLIIPFNLLSAVLVYFDAENIRAGYKFEEVTLLGEVSTWRPIVWAVAVFVVPFILFLFYLCSRREVYNANT